MKMKHGLARYSPRQEELAQKIANDINEGIDCGESHNKLRMAVAYWADAFDWLGHQLHESELRLMVANMRIAQYRKTLGLMNSKRKLANRLK